MAAHTKPNDYYAVKTVHRMLTAPSADMIAALANELYDTVT